MSSSKQIAAVPASGEPNRVTRAILDFVSRVPESSVDSSTKPAKAAQHLSVRAAQRAALAAGSLALPPGPLGWLTLLPELIAIWKIQGQLVSDIAAAYGRHAALGREQMMWCLFRHTAAQAFRDLVVRMGDRLVFRRMSYGITQNVARQIGVKLSQRTVGKGVTRWLPVVGALGVGAYAYYDTMQVASTAIDMMESEGEMEDAAVADAEIADIAESEKSPPRAKPAPRAKKGSAPRAVARKVDAVVSSVARKAVTAVRKRTAKTARKPKKTPDQE